MEHIPDILLSDLAKLNSKRKNLAGLSGAQTSSTRQLRNGNGKNAFAASGGRPLPFPVPDAASNENLTRGSLTEMSTGNSGNNGGSNANGGGLGERRRLGGMASTTALGKTSQEARVELPSVPAAARASTNHLAMGSTFNLAQANGTSATMATLNPRNQNPIHNQSISPLKQHATLHQSLQILANPNHPPNTSVAPENAYTHAGTAPRVAHLNAKHTNNDLAFVYEKEGGIREGREPGAGAIHATMGGTTVTFEPNDVQIVAAGATIVRQGDGFDETPHYPTLRPTTRKEVQQLKNNMIRLLQEIGADPFADPALGPSDYPTDMHAFLSIIQEEQKIYDTVFSEIIRQVTVNMIERGEVLSEIRKRYSSMFVRIPRHISNLHTELVAQRKLNRRLSEELIRARETVADLLRELEFVRKHDSEVTRQAQEAQEKLVSVLTQSDNTDEILEEYHKLYRMQRDRLEESIRLTEQEKRIWIDAATNLAMRVGHEHGLDDLVWLQKHEEGRLRSAGHMVIVLSETNDSEMSAIERKIEEWRAKIIRLSQSVVEEDHQSMETLSKAQKDMSLVLKNLTANEPMDKIESEHPLLKSFHIYDVKTLAEHLKTWVEQVGVVAIRFTGDRDLTVQEEIASIRKMAETWIEAGVKLLRRQEKGTNGKEYMTLSEILGKLALEIEEWLSKLDLRVSGEDGIASQVISLQNQLEDRFTAFSARDLDKPLPPSERAQIKESLHYWIEQIGLLINTLSNTTEKEQHKTPLHVENLISRILDQMATDIDLKNEENMKLHTSMVSWMVQLLVKGGKEAPSEVWDQEFAVLNQELISFNTNLMRDTVDIEMMSDDQKDLKKVVQDYSDNWLLLARKLLVTEKKSAMSKLAEQEKRPPTASTISPPGSSGSTQLDVSSTPLTPNSKPPSAL